MNHSTEQQVDPTNKKTEERDQIQHNYPTEGLNVIGVKMSSRPIILYYLKSITKNKRG